MLQLNSRVVIFKDAGHIELQVDRCMASRGNPFLVQCLIMAIE